MGEKGRGSGTACTGARARPWLLVILLCATVIPRANGSEPLLRGAKRHVCIHDQVALPSHIVHTIQPVPELQRAYEASETGEHAVNVTIGDIDGRERNVTEKNMRFQIVYLFDSACKNVGQSVTTFVAGMKKCGREDILTKWRIRSLKVMMKAATSFLSNALLVNRTRMQKIQENVCVHLKSPAVETLEGDFVVFVTANPSSDETSTVAWALHCAKHGTTKRPIVGHVNFIPSLIERRPSLIDEQVAIHELTHALGFTNLASAAAKSVSSGGQVREGVKTVLRPYLGKQVTVITMPKVVTAARRHFGCPSLDGLEVEDMGPAGTRGSHWKKRILFHEALVGTITSGRMYYSSMTLAFLEELGFYKANFSAAEDDFSWGKRKGCDFVLRKCNDQPANVTEFCFRRNLITAECTADHSSLGACDVVTHGMKLPTEFQYFEDPARGGSSAEMDYCPTVSGYENAHCSAEMRFPFMNFFGNEMGFESYCFKSNVITSVFPNPPMGARCFPATCTPEGQVVLRVQGQTVLCPADGKEGTADTAHLIGVRGRITCPVKNRICPTQTKGGPRVQQSTGKESDDEEKPPPPVTRGPPAFSKSYESSCSERTTCVGQHANLFPACGLMLRKIVECFGNDCMNEMAQAFGTSSMKKLCSNPQRAAELCMDGWAGANELCSLVNSFHSPSLFSLSFNEAVAKFAPGR
ncbi:putative Leishmanolysin [Trypanosoma vivax]|uniref:Leishmanolysin-like peptidase n=1 Tax=Trypanosoma vivax (strain Y486) TaxID=1055687 RepID=G0UBW9_TRYVY|nr:putative major surface protease A [Trypanosoma vivax]KAH8609533.1 putative Leishmanolysin [Trypanosoma vivax]KAH8609601.1 putative Leishmanolysin [Trypanosoma vivax]CCC53317.1 putative major surface protease A [Trypanosoma vivax Y486]